MYRCVPNTFAPWGAAATRTYKISAQKELSMKNENDEIKGKQAYEKPRLRVIELVAEEVMGVGCKTATGPGPVTLCAAGACFAAGS
jgi:hypothetical protein